jgi:hypothetical protein
MYRIRYLLDRYKLKTKVEVGHHKYLNNLGKDFEKMDDLCYNLGFFMRDITAYFGPIEHRIDFYENKEIKNLTGLYPLFINKDVVSINGYDIRSSELCKYQTNQICIDCAGKVQICCNKYH